VNPTPSVSTGATRGHRPRAALAVLVLGLFMTLLDITIVNVAIPSMLSGLHASLDQALWVLNAYSLLYAVLLITSARFGDIVGPRNLFAAGMGLFTLASVLSGMSQSPEQLIAARALQGFGAAIAAPQAMPLMLTLFPADRRGGVFAVYGIAGGLAVLAGPTLGGLLVTHFGWRWIFFVNLPVGVLTVALAMWLVPDLRPGRPHRFDLAGVALATLGLVGIVFGLIEGERYSWGTITGFVTIPEIIGAGVLALVLFGVQQARRQDREPLLPFAVFRDRNFTLMTLVMAGLGFAMVGAYLPLTIYLQSVLGLSAIAAGLTIAPQPLAMMVSSGVASGLVGKVSGKYLLIPGLVVFGAGLAFIDWAMTADAGRWIFIPGLIASGLGLGFVWTPVFSLATRDLRPDLAGVASGVVNTIQELGGVMAGAAIGAVLQSRLATALHDQAVHFSSQVPAPYQGRFVDAFNGVAQHGFQVGAGQTGAGVPAAIQAVAHQVFAHAFVDAARVSLLLPIGIIFLAAVATLGVRVRPLQPEAAEEVLGTHETAA
jgi:EmrB/QacA subfamily drug resistance transporter